MCIIYGVEVDLNHITNYLLTTQENKEPQVYGGYASTS